ncbi:hypothetical protein T4A_5985 [Trichinella pseudospiralis]|uniref:Uncharacterized protein n=1 Tax=Trichinella pseudospiralis TaxID=6337 RepID=A0A0V1DJR5_TRIPS|nr:hypothetical protein T4A_5985 [Trichinella pseudospiralis]
MFVNKTQLEFLALMTACGKEQSQYHVNRQQSFDIFESFFVLAGPCPPRIFVKQTM